LEQDIWEDTFEALLIQEDPGRMLHAFIIGGYLELRTGSIVLFSGDHIASLLRWLEGCPGMTFRIVENSEVDWDSFKFSKASRKFLKEHGHDLSSNLNGVNIMYDSRLELGPKPVVHDVLSSPPSYNSATATSLMAVTEMNGAAPKRRRPPPPRPTTSLRKAKMVYDFKTDEEGELSVGLGELVDVLNEMDDGWISVRRENGAVGVVPGDYTIPVAS